MKRDWSGVEEFRIHDYGYNSNTGDHFGAFRIKGCGILTLLIVDDGLESGWEHVSASSTRSDGGMLVMPQWQWMCEIKSMFWEDEECVVQFHPPKSRYINQHPGVLHLWRPVDGKFPMPPLILV